MIDRPAIAALQAREAQGYVRQRARCAAIGRESARHFLYCVPMHWVDDWGTPSPLFVRQASAAQLICADGHAHTDLCLADTAAMFGHRPPALARALAGRRRILVFDGWYHGTIDEAFVDREVLPAGAHGLPWCVTRVGARCEFQLCAAPPHNGREARASMDHELQAAIHLCLLNRGIRITPFHSMLLYCPVTQEGEVDRLAQVLGDCLAELTRRQSRRGPWPASRGPFRQ